MVVDSVKRCQQLWGTQCLVGGIDRRKEMNSKIALSDSVPVYILVGQVRTVVIQSFAYLDPTCNPAMPMEQCVSEGVPCGGGQQKE